MLQHFGLLQIIKNPTHYGATKDSILDVIFTNSNFISNSGVGNVNLSDHEIVCSVRKKAKTKRNSGNFDKNKLISEFERCDWEEFDNMNDPESLWQIYESNVRKVLDPMCPLKKFKIAKDRDTWISDDLINEIKHKDYLLKKEKKKEKCT